MVKVIWHKTASPPQMDGSITFARWRQCALSYGHIATTWRIQLNLCFLRPTPVENLNSISISWAALHTDDSRVSLYFTMGAYLPKVAPSHGGSGPNLIHV